MANKVVNATQLDADLLSVANAIRNKGNTSAALLFPDEFVTAINDIHGGGGDAYAAISVTYPAGSVCTCSQTGQDTLTAEDTSGSWLFVVPVSGTWTITATNGEKTATKTVEVEQFGIYKVSLAYNLLLMSPGYQNTEVIGSIAGSGFSQVENGWKVSRTGSISWTNIPHNTKLIPRGEYIRLTVVVSDLTESAQKGVYLYGTTSMSGNILGQVNFTTSGKYSIDISNLTSFAMAFNAATKTGGTCNFTINELYLE